MRSTLCCGFISRVILSFTTILLLLQTVWRVAIQLVCNSNLTMQACVKLFCDAYTAMIRQCCPKLLQLMLVGPINGNTNTTIACQCQHKVGYGVTAFLGLGLNIRHYSAEALR